MRNLLSAVSDVRIRRHVDAWRTRADEARWRGARTHIPAEFGPLGGRSGRGGRQVGMLLQPVGAAEITDRPGPAGRRQDYWVGSSPAVEGDSIRVGGHVEPSEQVYDELLEQGAGVLAILEFVGTEAEYLVSKGV
ncbi:hypothetical protein [Streptomyces sp. 8N706]|uniref:hypothetical protein n=1 Tax=Streptomyces sp. 8N706 TaxID=3457416 RepID=UPI003FD3D804